MNKLDTTNNGKQPIFLNDIRFVDEANRNAFFALIKAISKDENRILYGCEITTIVNDDYSIAEGAVVIQGEVLQVSAQNFTTTNLADTYFILQETDLAEGIRVFGNGSTHYVYKKRDAQIVEDALPDANLVCSLSLTPLANKKYEPVGSTETNVDEYFVTLDYLNRSASAQSGSAVFTPLAPAYFTTNNDSWLKIITNGNTLFNKFYLKIDTGSPGTGINDLSVQVSSVFVMSPGFKYHTLIKEGSAYHHGLIDVLASTPTQFRLTKLDGTPFAPSEIVEVWFETVVLL